MKTFVLTSLTLLLAACTPPAADPTAECQLDGDCGVDELCVSGACAACDVVLELPAGNDPCLPKCGNELGVGMPCTVGGGECSDNGNIRALFCSVDQVADADLALCTGPCLSDADCGSASVCSGDPKDPGGPKGCIPATCSEGEGEGEGEGE